MNYKWLICLIPIVLTLFYTFPVWFWWIPMMAHYRGEIKNPYWKDYFEYRRSLKENK